ncbi:MAG: hypothetical protein PVJ04_10915, partial [Gemmatimonadota bacterium]
MRPLTPSLILSIHRAGIPRPLLALLIAPMALTACADSVGPGEDAAGPMGLILFVSDREGAVGSDGEMLS